MKHVVYTILVSILIAAGYLSMPVSASAQTANPWQSVQSESRLPATVTGPAIVEWYDDFLPQCGIFQLNSGETFTYTGWGNVYKFQNNIHWQQYNQWKNEFMSANAWRRCNPSRPSNSGPQEPIETGELPKVVDGPALVEWSDGHTRCGATVVFKGSWLRYDGDGYYMRFAENPNQTTITKHQKEYLKWHPGCTISRPPDFGPQKSVEEGNFPTEIGGPAMVAWYSGMGDCGIFQLGSNQPFTYHGWGYFKRYDDPVNATTYNKTVAEFYSDPQNQKCTKSMPRDSGPQQPSDEGKLPGGVQGPAVVEWYDWDNKRCGIFQLFAGQWFDYQKEGYWWYYGERVNDTTWKKHMEQFNAYHLQDGCTNSRPR